jgi:hypothetical protein
MANYADKLLRRKFLLQKMRPTLAAPKGCHSLHGHPRALDVSQVVAPRGVKAASYFARFIFPLFSLVLPKKLSPYEEVRSLWDRLFRWTINERDSLRFFLLDLVGKSYPILPTNFDSPICDFSSKLYHNYSESIDKTNFLFIHILTYDG